MSDQSSRYIDLRTNLETELANTDKQISSINARLAAIPTDTAGNAINPNDVATRAQLETSLSQYEQARSYLVSDYQQLMLSEVLSTSTVVQKRSRRCQSIAHPATAHAKCFAGGCGGFHDCSWGDFPDYLP